MPDVDVATDPDFTHRRLHVFQLVSVSVSGWLCPVGIRVNLSLKSSLPCVIKLIDFPPETVSLSS